jgi:hypothetical protein
MRDSRGRRESGLGYLIDRRGFLGAAAALALAPAALVRAAELETALEESGLVYVSPLLADGSESTCHGEVWFGWIDGAVVIITGAEGWKARALGRGLESARLWVGDHGRWKKLVTRNEAFRAAPSFDARAETVRDAELLDRLLAIFDRKYPEEIGRWRERMRNGHADGSRVLIRYRPLES